VSTPAIAILLLLSPKAGAPFSVIVMCSVVQPSSSFSDSCDTPTSVETPSEAATEKRRGHWWSRLLRRRRTTPTTAVNAPAEKQDLLAAGDAATPRNTNRSNSNQPAISPVTSLLEQNCCTKSEENWIPPRRSGWWKFPRLQLKKTVKCSVPYEPLIEL